MRFPVFYMACFAVAFLLERMSEAAHSALRKSEKKYEYLCNHDALTKLYNRFWLQSIVADIDKLEIKPSAVAIIDIDNFKYINDSFGHPNGDVVICGMANAIGEALNQSGALCRWGGDEFLVLFHTDIDADTVCNRVIDVVRACEFDLDGKKMKTTVSIGLVMAPNGSTDDINALIRQADINLYSAKEAGRNRMISSRLGD
jgi:diguanylate cyclase (GGDEF)-like protein